MPQIIPPPPNGLEFTNDSWAQFFELIRKQLNTPRYYSQTTDPGTAGVPSGTWSIWLNSSSGVLKIWANQNGTMKSVTLT
jgi:hypothetical protein